VIRTHRQIVLDAFDGEQITMTATQLGKITGLKLESLSSVLKKMVDAGLLERVGGFGPRGGYGYTVVKEKP